MLKRLGVVMGCLIASTALAELDDEYRAAERTVLSEAKVASTKGDYAGAAASLEALVTTWSPKFPKDKAYETAGATSTAAAYRRRQTLEQESAKDPKGARAFLLHLLDPKSPEIAVVTDACVSKALATLKRVDPKAATFFDSRKVQVTVSGEGVTPGDADELGRRVTAVLGSLGYGTAATPMPETFAISLSIGETIDMSNEGGFAVVKQGISCELKAAAEWGQLRFALSRRGLGLASKEGCLRERATEMPNFTAFRVIEAWNKANP